ncbi:MAG: 1-acyl-sn-glycerol-3-phosphate acyltransferase [Clostridiales bacterium]|nr:1-acyl-sn-glycerol-3-phosphate acyltransferase [Clostridiales bacterium]
MDTITTEQKGEDRRKRDLRTGWAIAKAFVAPSLKRKYRYSCDTIDIDGPFLIIANHANNQDPILMGLASPERPLSFVGSEHLERLGFITKLLTKYFSLIPRSKASSGFGAVRNILDRLKKGGAVMLFAEGDCTWDGVTHGVFPATGKLAKAAKVPLVTYRLEGNYLSRPRWADSARRGRLTGKLVGIYSPSELAAMSPEEVTRAIDRDIFYDSWAAQRDDPVPFSSNRRAEGLERALFICPECGRVEAMASKGNRFFCKNCGAQWEVDEYCFLHGPRFSTIAEWDAWQEKAVREMAGEELFKFKAVFTDLAAGISKKALVSLDASNGRINVSGRDAIPFSEITDMAMVKTNRLLFAFGGSYCEIKTKRGILRPYLLSRNAFRDETGGNQ